MKASNQKGKILRRLTIQGEEMGNMQMTMREKTTILEEVT
jgi:hypothetical protein